IARAAHTHWLAAQRRTVAHLDRGIEAVHIEMDDCVRLCISFHRANVASMVALSSLRNTARLRFGEIYVMTNRVKTIATRVFMVRHGVTVLSAEDRFAGATDVALSDEGREQTRR